MNLRSGMKPSDDKLGADSEENYGLIHTERNGSVVREKVETINGDYGKYFQNVANAINNTEQLTVSANDGLNIIRVIEKAYESNGLKTVVKI
jgi:predicted dehydrogenase